MNEGGAPGPLLAPRIARVIVALVFTGFGTVALTFMTDPDAGVGWTTTLTVAYTVIATVLFIIELYALTRLARLITELHAARNELANAAVAHERLRFARDLHDLLGLSLSVIVPKGELAVRLIERNPDRACRELTEVMEIARRALGDARTVARGYRDRDLDEESRTAESVLAASRVRVRMDLNHGELPAHIRTALAAVLREGVANVLEHSAAERCEIVMRQAGGEVSLDIVNDGLDGRFPAGSCPSNGSGLTMLSARALGLGGRLSTAVEPDGRFRLRLTLPVAGREPPGQAPEPAGSGRDPVRLGRTLVAAALAGTAGLAGLHLAALRPGLPELVVGIGYLAGVLALQLGYFSRPSARPRAPVSYGLLVVLAGLVALSATFGVPWLAVPGFLAGNVLLVLRPAVAGPLAAAVVAGAGAHAWLAGGTLTATMVATGGTVVTGSVVYGLTWMTSSVTQLRTARVRLTRAAVAQERLRFARDLHDLLGLSLSAITLKTELAHRLVGRHPARARAELTEILAICRRALADVRLVASGFRTLSFEEECRSAESLLAAAEVEVRLDVAVGELPGRMGTLLATVLREGVTNVLRHSKGEHCEITVRERAGMVSLDIVNDGTGDTGGPGGVAGVPVQRPDGAGIDNLAYRVAMVGGTVTAGVEPDGRFRLRAQVPS